jgi:hypothetical protein
VENEKKWRREMEIDKRREAEDVLKLSSVG